jgi:2-polyprenyl-3-methyl-5-hydroxy-6-metoxy-1,4-benzoquinol methylase
MRWDFPGQSAQKKSEQEKAKIFRDDGAAFHRWGNLERAEQSYLKALDCVGGSKDHQTLYKMAELFLEKKDSRRALEYYILAIYANPDEPLHKQRFLDICGSMHFERHDADAEDILLRCLKTPDLDFSNAAPMWSSILLGNPAFAALYGDAKLFEKKFDPAPLLQPCFTEGLKKITVHDLAFEDFMRRLRQWLLMGLPGLRGMMPADYIRLAEAVASYCYHGGYIIRVTAAERAKLREISSRVTDRFFATAFACYDLQGVSPVFEPGSVMATLQHENEQIRNEPDTINVSYEARWRTVPAHTLKAELFFSARQYKLERTFAGLKPELLVAGCGAGRDTIIAAVRYARGKITVLDTCRENIAYTAAKASEHNVQNVDFKMEDFSILEKLPKAYDIIYVMNALNHQQDPVKVLQSFWNNLKPAGLMKIGLASKMALQKTQAIYQAIQAFNISDSRESILDFRDRAADFLPEEMLKSFTARPAYYSFPTYRDMFFRPALHQFTLLEIEEILAQLRLRFEGFDLPASVLRQYAEKFPDDAEMSSLKNWHQFEQEYPETFTGLYRFWCRKF